MHIAAAINQIYWPGSQKAWRIIRTEKKVLTEQVLNEGKPANIVEKWLLDVKQILAEISLNDQHHFQLKIQTVDCI